MHVPVGETVELQMHSTDVIHSFYVPAFLYQRDITPRKDQVIQFLADREGTYRGQCTQFCGLLHQAMEFEVVVESRDSYNAWLEEALTPAPTPTPAPTTSAAPGASQPPGTSASLTLTASGIAYRHGQPGGAGRHALPDRVHQQRRRDPPQRGHPRGQPHRVRRSGQGEIFNGVETRTYDVPALPAGTYGFVCTVHPNMTGTLTAR